MTRQANDISFGHYIAAYLDLIGQREHIKRLENLPRNEIERTQFIDAVKNSVGVVHEFRRTFELFFSSFGKTDASLPHVDDPQYLEIKELYERDQLFEVRFQTFGDTLILFSPVADQSNGIRWRTVFAFLASVAGTIPMYLALGHAFRGGIDIAVGVEHRPNELYGPVLRDTYLLESNDADYARVVVGPGLFHLIGTRAYRGVLVTDPQVRCDYVQAMTCEHYIAKDLDGRHVVDYARSEVLKDMPSQTLEFLRESIDVTRAQLDQATKESDSRKAVKLSRLVSYLTSRQRGWSLLNPEHS